MSSALARATVRDRNDMEKASRVVVKVGSSSLTAPNGHLSLEAINDLVAALASVIQRGTDIVLVSSGAIATGIGPMGLTSKPTDVPTAQAAASVGQGLLMAQYTRTFAHHALRVGQVLLTPSDLMRRAHYRNAQSTLSRLLELGIVPVVNENDAVATDEIRFGDNDRLAALVAHLVRADALVLLTDVDGLYTKPPTHPGAERIAVVDDVMSLRDVQVTARGSDVGTGGMVTKLEAASIATGTGVPVIVTSTAKVSDVFTGGDVGTFFTATGRRRPARLLWLAYAANPEGKLRLDDGAVCAVVDRNASLLPAGITEVIGDFVPGDAVDLVDTQDKVIARGFVTYSSVELPMLLGRSTHDLAAELGPEYEREVVHTDDLVVARTFSQ